jgi:hypothetical protein
MSCIFFTVFMIFSLEKSLLLYGLGLNMLLLLLLFRKGDLGLNIPYKWLLTASLCDKNGLSIIKL